MDFLKKKRKIIKADNKSINTSSNPIKDENLINFIHSKYIKIFLIILN